MKDMPIFDAIDFAAKAHRGQFRKGSNLPYIFHPLSVGRILLEMEYDDSLVIAGFLHDTIEDTDVTAYDITNIFGARVTELVLGVSEKIKSDPWEKRKQDTLDKLLTEEIDIVVLSCADKLDNIRSIRTDYEKIGEAVWSRFNRPVERQHWYYENLSAVFKKRLTEFPHSKLAELFQQIVGMVFPADGTRQVK